MIDYIANSCLAVVCVVMQGVFVIFWCYVFNENNNYIIFFLFGAVMSITNPGLAKEAFSKIGRICSFCLSRVLEKCKKN